MRYNLTYIYQLLTFCLDLGGAAAKPAATAQAQGASHASFRSEDQIP